MADVTSRLRLVVDSTGLDKSGRKLRDLRNEARKADEQARRLRSAFAGLAGVLGAAFSVRELTKIADEYTEISNRLRVVTNGASDLRSTLEAVGDVARRTQGSLEATATLYSRVTQFAGDAFESQKQTLDFVEAINNSFLAAGASATEAKNAIRQLTQGLASGELRGEEFRSISEQAPLLAKALEAAVGDATKSVFDLAKEGAFTTDVVIKAALDNFQEFQRQAANIAPTIGRSLQILRDQFLLVFGDNMQKASEGVAHSILSIADNLESLRPFIEGIGAAILAIGTGFALPAIGAAFAALLSPLGAVALAIGAVVAFRDDIAEWAFGVRDAGAVVRAAIEVIAPLFTGLYNSIRSFVAGALPLLADFAQGAADLLGLVGESVTGLIQTVNDAVNRVQIDAAKRQLEELAQQQRSLVDELIEIGNAPIISPGMELGRKEIEKQLDSVNEHIAETRQNLQELLNPPETGGLGGVLDEIRSRAQEIVTAREQSAEVEENVTRQTRKTANEVARLSAEYKKLKDAAEKASGGILRDAQDLISGFEKNVRRADIRFAGPDARDLAEALQREFEKLVEDIDNLSIGLNEKQLRELYNSLEDAGIEWGREIEDAARSGALGLGAAIRQALADGVQATAGLINFGANIGRDIVDGIGGALDVIKDPLASLGDKILGGVESIASGLASIPGPIGAVAGAVASVAGLVKDIINLFKKPSDKTAQTVFNIFSGSVAGSADDNAPENAKLRDEIAETIRDFNRQIIGLTGATRGSNSPSTRANEAFINLAVRTDRSTGETFFDVGFQSPNGEQSGGGRFSTQAEAIDEAVRLSISTLRGGASDLLDIAQALANTDLGASDIIDSLNTIIELTDLGGEPLSEYQQRIKELNDVFDDAIRKVNGVAEAEAKLNGAREKAIQGVTRDFNRDIQEQIGGFLNGPLDELEKLLKSQEQRFEEASKLGADIAQVERLAALELRDFFEGLSDNALQEVQSFLGLFEEASNSVARNLDLSRQDLQSTRDFFAQSAQQFAQLRTDNIERFIAASPRESIGILQGRATDLLGQVREGNQSAAQALPQVLSQLIDSARQSFGNTKGFTEVFNFVQGILSDAEAASLAVVSDAERQIAALDESNVILSDIRDILSSSQAANAFFQSYSSGGIASADELLSLIQQGAGLTVASNDNAAALNITGLIAQSVVPIVMPIADSINLFTQRLSDLPDLARLQIEATDRVNDTLNDRFDDMVDVLERIENLEKRQLAAYEEAA